MLHNFQNMLCDMLNAVLLRIFNNHDCLGIASQVTTQEHHQRANASGSKAGFELVTEGIQFYVFANKTTHPNICNN